MQNEQLLHLDSFDATDSMSPSAASGSTSAISGTSGGLISSRWSTPLPPAAYDGPISSLATDDEQAQQLLLLQQQQQVQLQQKGQQGHSLSRPSHQHVMTSHQPVSFTYHVHTEIQLNYTEIQLKNSTQVY